MELACQRCLPYSHCGSCFGSHGLKPVAKHAPLWGCRAKRPAPSPSPGIVPNSSGGRLAEWKAFMCTGRKDQHPRAKSILAYTFGFENQ